MSDSEYALNCPACGGQMTEVLVPSANIYVDICLDGCGGIYFDNRELEHFDEQHEDISAIIEAKSGKTFKEVDENAVRLCPVCGAEMVKHFVSAKQEITIDHCYSCGGKFLDHGELLKIRAQFKTEQERREHASKYFNDIIGKDIDKLETLNEKKQYKHPLRDLYYNLFFKL